MPIQQNPNKRRGEERSETLIIPHITREMLEVARAMAEKGASRAEIEAAMWIDHVLDDSKPLVTKPEQAFVVTQILEAIYTSAQTGKPVYFD